MVELNQKEKRQFQETVWRYYERSGRHRLPWRQTGPKGHLDPYLVVVSEVMLQQTQVDRTVPKYLEFTERFPSFADLAAAELGDVLRAWSGLGYNRRAKFLHQTAQTVVTDYGGVLPRGPEVLVALPGIGPNTAGAIITYAYDEPAIFVETNIRTVFIHHFFADQIDVSDKRLLDLVDATLDKERPREWYWALMDYGTELKRSVGNTSRRSQAYRHQSKFEGSLRQIRGQVITSLAAAPRRLAALQTEIPDDRLSAVIDDLLSEGMIRRRGDNLSL